MKGVKNINKYQRTIYKIARKDADKRFLSYRKLRKIVKEVIRENEMSLEELVEWKEHRKFVKEIKND